MRLLTNRTTIFSNKLKSFSEDPFGFVDRINLKIKGFDFNIFQKYKRTQKVAFFGALLCLMLWAICGFDSTPLQFVYFLFGGVAYFEGTLSYDGWMQTFGQAYGKEMHYSAFVFYFLAYWYLSRYFEKNFGIEKSKNVAYACSLTFLNIALFEFYWMYSFAFWQNQWWVVTWQMPQLRVLLQNVAFLSLGVLGVLHMWVWSFKLEKKEIVGREYRFNWSWISVGLVALSVCVAVFWWFYPWHVDAFTVAIQGVGNWTNSVHFPQTLYTIDTTPSDGVNAGVWFYKPNDLVHLVNTIVKAIWTFTVCWIGKIRKVS